MLAASLLLIVVGIVAVVCEHGLIGLLAFGSAVVVLW